MSRFLTERFRELTPYVPGEQPQDQKYIKLNTNESPFPTSQKAVAKAAEAAKNLQLYSDPDCRKLREKLAENLNRAKGTNFTMENILVSNGSDEVLNFAFMAFADKECPAVFPDITYGFYPVFSDMNGIPYVEIALDDDFRINPEDYCRAGGMIVIANPNAHTGVALSLDQLEKIISSNKDNVVIVDEAYVDFGAESAVELVDEYDNLLVTQTFSKSRSLAGARLGFGVAGKGIIRDLDTIRNSTNPYNINSMTMAAGIGVLDDEEYTLENCRKIIENRRFTAEGLNKLGFRLTDSAGNFVFMKHPEIDGGFIYEELKKRGILVRHFTKDRIAQYNRVTIGSRREMEKFLGTLEEITGGTQV